MEKTDLINYYKRSCFIFSSAPVSIEDDEILDLDSISLDSNEDTWLWSNSQGNSFKEASSEEIKQCLDNVSVDDLTNSSSRISLTNWDSFKEQTVNDSFFNQKNTPLCKKLDCNSVQNTTPANHNNGGSTDALIENEVTSLKKPDLFPDEQDIFKKPLSKKDISEKNNILYSIENKLFSMGDTDTIDHRNQQINEIKNIERDNCRKILESVIVGQEKNYVELNGSEKQKSLINEPTPLCHSTPMPMLTKRRISRTENENKSWQKSIGQDIGCGDSPLINSSSFGRRERSVDSAGESTTESKLTEVMTELSIKEKESMKGLNGTFEVDDNASTSSSDSRRSSSSINYPPRTVPQTRTISRPSSSNPRFDSGLNGNIRSPSRASNGRRAPLTETKMKQPSRRAPSLNRLPAPSLNIDEEFVSVVEIKSKNSTSKIGDKKTASGPVSHLPRPSTRIPVFRSSNSCTRSTFKK